jgi:hypothetical protein
MGFALRVESPMLSRVAVIAGACLLGAIAAKAEELGPEQARAFVVGKLFSYTCFDGTAGMGRIFADGSVVGTIRPGGRGEMRFANLPPGTLRIEGSSMCAHLSGMIVQPCFRVQKIDYRRFRGSISGLGFAYCDFYQHNPRADMISRMPEPRTRMTSRVPLPPAAQVGRMAPFQSAPLGAVQSAPMAAPALPPPTLEAAKPAPAAEAAKPAPAVEAAKSAPAVEAAKPAPAEAQSSPGNATLRPAIAD